MLLELQIGKLSYYIIYLAVDPGFAFESDLVSCGRVEVMDPAVLRPGRLGKLLYVPLPTADERALILKALARKKPIAADVDFVAIAHREECNNLTGADLSALV